MTFKKGQSGNPMGRPKKNPSIVDVLVQRLRQNQQERKEIVDALIKKAKTGDMKAITEIMDRVDGRVADLKQLEREYPVRIIFIPASQQPVLEPAIETDYSMIEEANFVMPILPVAHAVEDSRGKE